MESKGFGTQGNGAPRYAREPFAGARRRVGFALFTPPYHHLHHPRGRGHRCLGSVPRKNNSSTAIFFAIKP